MTSTQALESLFSNGVSQVTIGIPEQRKGMIFATAVHGVPHGSPGNQIVFNHQSVDEKVEECLSNLADQVKKALSLKVEPTIVTLPNSDRRN